ncbi:MAG: hypothetical protein MPEBLZ_02970 [Candidatus Methanoperedens nitroreducens]|uniref:Uncharacterized protein n=1 Tax=Candidatus Methanoperedens nitratireducens TaxID=1392998 RepID=A0A0P8AE69_9EURY|nr:hypothetical protein [Candidatus Methanoperedens sp. BLZ2]KPQ42512.1 MAG: hypothetical protein MPEBLZ_02970 [Candidatus Methanoperedens sp. BLZ1]MBZ0173803.1 hypothetical protein [Candidatus Methanoperedens nitroreducens]MCX9078302.1 hypothetical protein [Candidatus Methanoperedens sp.]CAG0993255.1 hypothetical protein METP2_02746 [Methanosarcinales archaeon]MCX9089590.1 hypothetical protein [Candidatus Methanoperedens sp.]
MNKLVVYVLLGIFAFGIFSNMAASALSEEKMLPVGSTWEKTAGISLLNL